MKTLTSFAIALFAVRRSFAIVVRSRRVNFPGFAVPGRSLPQQSGVSLSYQAKRHLAAISAMVQRDDEEEDVTGSYPQPFIFDLPHKPLEREFYKRRLSGLPLHLKKDFEKFVHWFRSKKFSMQHA